MSVLTGDVVSSMDVAGSQGSVQVTLSAAGLAKGMVGSLAQIRQKKIANFLAGAAIAAPNWAAATAYTPGQCVTLPTGQVITCTNAGTSGATAPALSKTALSGRPITDNGVTWYGVYSLNGAGTTDSPLSGDVPVGPNVPPSVAVYASAAAAGLTETLLSTGGVLNPALKVWGGIASGVNYANSLAGIALANGLVSGGATGNVTSEAVAAGYSNLYAYSSNACEAEFYITDSVVAITLISGSNVNPCVTIDGVLMQAASPFNATLGQCLVFDFNGVVKRRLVNVVVPGGNMASPRGVALSTIGFIEPTDSPNDQMLILGDSIPNTIVAGNWVVPIGLMAQLIPRYLGLSGGINACIGGTGYVANNGGAGFTIGQNLANVSNISIWSALAPTHILITAGLNDRATSWTTVGPAALAAWQAARSLFPSAKITITDGFSASGPDSNALTQAANLLALFNTWGDRNSRFVQSIGPSASTAWVQGTGYSTTALAAGNSCNFVGSDGIHPTLLGANYQAQRMANAISAAWQTAY
jgi:hypothetical protein